MNSPRSPGRSRWRAVHRLLAIVAGCYFLLMAVSGILLNHRQLLAGLDVPRSWLPGDYAYRNWNRNALRGSVESDYGARYLYGESGVWLAAPGGKPLPFMTGFPEGAYRRDTRALLRVAGDPAYLLAATRNGLYACPTGDETASAWRPVALPGVERNLELVDLLRTGDRVVVVSRSRLYAADPAWPLRFTDITPPRVPDPEPELPLFRLLFHAHSGEVWGAAGQLAVDAVGVLLVLFTVTGVWFWWRRRRGTLVGSAGGKLCRQGLRLHVRMGPWCAVLLLLVALTGLFQRPPFLIAVASVTYPPSLHPAPVPPNPWHDLLRKAAYDPERREIVLATDDGFFRGPLAGGTPLRRMGAGPPVSVMGANVFRRAPDGMFWVGSMSGLYVWDPISGWVTDAFTGNPPVRSMGPPVGDHAVSGLFFSGGGRPLIVDYFEGAIDDDGRRTPVPVPEELSEGGMISLWHVLFEIHNGRIFGFLLGWWSWLVVPLGGLALTVEALSGVGPRLRVPRRSRHRTR